MKTYELRDLMAKDLFPMMRILSKLDMKELKKSFDPSAIAKISQTGEVDLTEIVGMNIVFDLASIILANVPKCEDEIYTFLANISNLSKKEVEKLPMADFLQMIIDVITKQEFKDFFRQASKLIK